MKHKPSLKYLRLPFWKTQYLIKKKVLCSAEKGFVIWAEPNSRNSAKQFNQTKRSVSHYATGGKTAKTEVSLAFAKYKKAILPQLRWSCLPKICRRGPQDHKVMLCPACLLGSSEYIHSKLIGIPNVANVYRFLPFDFGKTLTLFSVWILVYDQIFEWEPFCNRIGFGLVIEMGAGKTTIFKAQIQYYMGSLY